MGMSERDDTASPDSRAGQWYDLFSRGARDWLRHNEKIREAVRKELPNLVAGSDLISRPDNRTVQVPVRFLEHARFRLRDSETMNGVGQGQGKPGDILAPARPEEGSGGAGGSGEGEIRFLLELKVDDIVDWLWEELKLPHLQPKVSHAAEDEELMREGWDRRGARARLDRRRTLKEAVKRRAVQGETPAFTDEDLRFRQLARRKRPATSAVVIFALDVSASMEEEQRRLAKTFFFWALQGIRRQYARVETVFIAHTAEAWEFTEEQFFQVTGEGGTVASTAFNLSLEILRDRFDPNRYNAYLFYASDGENFREDRHEAVHALQELASLTNFMGYVETAPDPSRALDTEMGNLFDFLADQRLPVGSYALTRAEDVWPAIRAFFREQAQTEGEQSHG
jgi:sporulation protein YhbH